MTWRFWRWFRRTASHPNQNESGYPPPWIAKSDRRSARFSRGETFFAYVVVFGVILEDLDKFPEMIAHPLSPEGITAVGGTLVALGIMLEVLCSSKSSHEEHRVRDWYASETERLRAENNNTALLQAYRSIGDLAQFTEAMRPFSGTKFALEMYVVSSFVTSNATQEISTLQWWLQHGLRGAGWIMVGHVSRRMNIGMGVVVMTLSNEPIQSPAAKHLSAWLDGCNVANWSGIIGGKDDLVSQGCTVLIEIGPKRKQSSSTTIKEAYQERLNNP